MIRLQLKWFLISLCIISIQSLSAPTPNEYQRQQNGVFQYSNISALLEGYLDGNMSLQRLSRKGDFGLGTLNGLDGELVALDGTFYQVKSDGKAYELPGTTFSPFAVVTHFSADIRLKLPERLDYPHLEALLSQHITQPNHIQAIRIDGRFSTLRVRSPKKQHPPYRRLGDIPKSEFVEFNYKDVEGTLVGFRFPGYLGKLNASGYHFHFIDKDRKLGGHILGLTTQNGEITIDNTTRFHMLQPDDEEFDKLTLDKDLSKELRIIEKGR